MQISNHADCNVNKYANAQVHVSSTCVQYLIVSVCMFQYSDSKSVLQKPAFNSSPDQAWIIQPRHRLCVFRRMPKTQPALHHFLGVHRSQMTLQPQTWSNKRQSHTIHSTANLFWENDQCLWNISANKPQKKNGKIGQPGPFCQLRPLQIPSCLNGTPRAAARRSAGVKGHSSCTNITRPVKTLS